MIEIITKDNLDEAKLAAQNEAADISGTTLLVSIFPQGDRNFLSAVFNLGYIVHNIKIKHIKRDKNVGLGLKEVGLTLNRPLDPDHAKSTKEYLLRNYTGKYILPAMTLNIQGGLNVYTGAAKSPVKPGYLVLPMGVNFTIADGQHRKAALDLLFEELSTEEFNKISNDGISVMITTEDDIAQIHQDFSDCSKTKQLPKSLIAVYDTRNPANALVMELVNKCPLLTGKVDAASNSLSKNSTKLFLVSQIRSLVKELFLGNSAYGDIDLEKRAHEQYVTPKSSTFTEDVEKYVNYINKVTEKIPVLKEISIMKEGVEMSKIPELRKDYLILNSAGINILGRIGNVIFKDASLYKDIDTFIEKLSAIDWKKNAEIWKGNIVQTGANGAKISTSNSTIKIAVKNVMSQIGIESKEQAIVRQKHKHKQALNQKGLF
ncbi:DNA sulfur modification protein DndB [soil metagenome]